MSDDIDYPRPYWESRAEQHDRNRQLAREWVRAQRELHKRGDVPELDAMEDLIAEQDRQEPTAPPPSPSRSQP